MSLQQTEMNLVYYLPKFMCEVLVLIFLTLFIVNLLSELGLFSKLINIIKPVSKLVKIPEEYVLCLSLCLIGPSLGYATLLKVMEDHRISSEDVYPVLLLSSPLTQICDTLRFGIPVALSVLGPLAGAIYAVLALSRAFLRLLIHATYVKTALSEKFKIIHTAKRSSIDCPKIRESKLTAQEIIKRSLSKTFKIFKRIAIRLVIVTAAIILLALLNIFQYLSYLLKPALLHVGFNQYMVTIIVVQLMNFLAALYTAGTFYTQGLLTLKQTLLAIFAGQIVTMPVMYFRQFLPYRASLFGFRTALKWVVFDTLTSLTTTVIIVLAILYLLPSDIV